MCIRDRSPIQYVLTWFGQYWSTVSLLGLVLVSLLVLRSIARAAPEATPTYGKPVVAKAEQPQPQEAQAEKPETPTRLKRARKPGMSLRDELSQLVAEDPDAAANILRTWIGKTMS